MSKMKVLYTRAGIYRVSTVGKFEDSENRTFYNGVWSRSKYHVDYETVESAIQQISETANKWQANILDISPLYDSMAHDFVQSGEIGQGGWGVGYGWGVQLISGFTALYQNEYWVEKEHFTSALDAVTKLTELNQECETLSKLISDSKKAFSKIGDGGAKYDDRLKNLEEIISNGVTEKKTGIISRTRYIVAGREYSDKHNAINALDTIKTDFERLLKEKNSLNAKLAVPIDELENEINNLLAEFESKQYRIAQLKETLDTLTNPYLLQSSSN